MTADDEAETSLPAPVEIVAPNPIPVTVVDEDTRKPPDKRGTNREQVQRQSIDPSAPATTTFQQDLTKAGQRRINEKWESTQQTIAIAITLTALLVCSILVVWPSVPAELRLLAFTLLSNAFFLVVGTYFQRTNHTKTGGVDSTDVGR